MIGCSNKKELNGYWFGEHKRKYIANPVLLKFEGNTYIDFTSFEADTIKYNYFRNNIYGEKNEFGEKRGFKYKIENNKLSLFDIKKDSLIIELRRPNTSCIVLDYLKDSSLKIDLPKSEGFDKTFGDGFKFEHPFYLCYKEGRLVANFLGTTRNLDSTYYEFLQNKRKQMDEDIYNKRWGKVLFVADKNIKISDFRNATSQLKMGNISSADFCLNSQDLNYEDLNIFSLRFPQMTEREYKIFEKYNIDSEEILLPPNFFTEKMLVKNENRIMLVEVFDKQIKLNNEVISKSDLKERLLNVIKEKNEVFIFYYLDEDMTYQDYVDYNLLFMKSIYSVRGDYLMNKYSIKYTGEKYNLGANQEIKEAMLKYPMVFHLLDSTELKMTKKVKF